MAREMIRQGGRSARIQQAVHAATRALLAEIDRAEISVPVIAERARVTPSTIYRRWGDVAQLLADVAAERLRPVAGPDDTGALASDLTAYVLQYAEEMSSQIGRQMLLDVLAEGGGDGPATRCCQYTLDALATLNARAEARGEPAYDSDTVIDLVFAPLIFHILFADRPLGEDYARALLARFFDQA